MEQDHKVEITWPMLNENQLSFSHKIKFGQHRSMTLLKNNMLTTQAIAVVLSRSALSYVPYKI